MRRYGVLLSVMRRLLRFHAGVRNEAASSPRFARETSAGVRRARRARGGRYSSSSRMSAALSFAPGAAPSVITLSKSFAFVAFIAITFSSIVSLETRR